MPVPRWCGHCKALAPEWANAAEQLKGQVKLGALDATVNQAVASRFAIKGYPTIKVFPGGTAKSDGDAEDYTGPRWVGAGWW
jgi:protein disulfide-isomerase A6